MNSNVDRAGVMAPPPLIYAAAVAVMLALRWCWPLPLQGGVALQVCGASLVALGLAFGLSGRRALGAAKTTVSPFRPTTAIVQAGSFRLSRNPLYVGMAVMFLGVSLLCATAWGFIVFVPVALFMHAGVILPEERYLARKFGHRYRNYCGRVRRYL